MMSSLASFVNGVYSELDGFSSMYVISNDSTHDASSQPGGYLGSVLLRYQVLGTFGASWCESQAFSFAFSNVSVQ